MHLLSNEGAGEWRLLIPSLQTSGTSWLGGAFGDGNPLLAPEMKEILLGELMQARRAKSEAYAP
jgi:hypothetical protein